jgi:hypothetical protein
MVAVGRTCYLAVPEHVSLTEGHCLIVPLSHDKCATLLDEDVCAEIDEFKRALSEMFRDGIHQIVKQDFRRFSTPVSTSCL